MAAQALGRATRADVPAGYVSQPRLLYSGITAAHDCYTVKKQ